jgi:hypothetical protein
MWSGAQPPPGPLEQPADTHHQDREGNHLPGRGVTGHLDREHHPEQGHDRSNHDQEKSKNSSHIDLPQQVKHATGLVAGE